MLGIKNIVVEIHDDKIHFIIDPKKQYPYDEDHERYPIATTNGWKPILDCNCDHLDKMVKLDVAIPSPHTQLWMKDGILIK